MLFTNRQNKQHTLVATLDYSKAFDTLDHHILLKRLDALGMSNLALSWFKSYLEDHRHCVKYNGTLSDFEQVVYSIPQGSLLGPTLFVVYVNNLLRILPVSCITAYADDLTITASDSSTDKAAYYLQELLDAIYSWSQKSMFHLNIAKCFVMHVSPSLRSRQTINICA